MFDFDLEREFVFESPVVAVVTTPFARSFISGTMVGRQAEIIPADVSTTHQVCASAIVPIYMSVLGKRIYGGYGCKGDVHGMSFMSTSKIRLKR